MNLTTKFKTALQQIAELPTDSKTWQEYAAKNKPLDWINVNKAIDTANDALASERYADPERERTALIQLRNHFNRPRHYALEEKIRVGMMIIDSGLKQDKPDYSKQLELGL